MKSPKMFRTFFLLAGLVVGSWLFCRDSSGILYTYGCKLVLTQVRAGKEGSKEDTDPALSREDVRAIKAKYGKRYKTYKLVSRETASAGFSKPLGFTLDNGKTLAVSFESHRQAWINMKIQVEDAITLMRVSSGERGVIDLPYDEEEGDTLVIIFQPSLIQATRK